jgi:hypothetical protein
MRWNFMVIGDNSLLLCSVMITLGYHLGSGGDPVVINLTWFRPRNWLDTRNAPTLITKVITELSTGYDTSVCVKTTMSYHVISQGE